MNLRARSRAVAVAVGVALLWATVVPARATLALTVEPLVVDFHLAAGENGSATIHISNTGTEPERVTVSPIDWRTTTEGTLRFGQIGTLGAHSITNFLKLPAYRFALAAGESTTIPLTLHLPASFSPAPAVYWGGFFIRAESLGVQGMAPAATVFVYDVVGNPRSHLALAAMRITQSGSNVVKLTARLLNHGNSYARVKVRLVVGQAGRIIRDLDLTTPTIFPGATRILTQDFRGLAPGEYRAEMSFDDGSDTVLTGSTEFRVP
jgi:hypothetical protein